MYYSLGDVSPTVILERLKNSIIPEFCELKNHIIVVLRTTKFHVGLKSNGRRRIRTQKIDKCSVAEFANNLISIDVD